MADAKGSSLQSVTAIVADILALADLRVARCEFRSVVVVEREPHSAAKQSTRFWVFVAFTDALVRLRLFVEQNFSYIEPMGILAVTRYTFELMVWLKRPHGDARGYGLVYYRVLLPLLDITPTAVAVASRNRLSKKGRRAGISIT